MSTFDAGAVVVLAAGRVVAASWVMVRVMPITQHATLAVQRTARLRDKSRRKVVGLCIGPSYRTQATFAMAYHFNVAASNTGPSVQASL